MNAQTLNDDAIDPTLNDLYVDYRRRRSCSFRYLQIALIERDLNIYCTERVVVGPKCWSLEGWRTRLRIP